MDEEASDVEPSETMKREIEEDSERDTKFLRTDSEEDEKPVKLKNEEERLEKWDSDSQSRESLENGEGKPPEVASEDPFPAPELPLFPKRDEISRENGEEKPFSSEKPRFSPEKPAGEEENGENEDENVNVDLPGEFPHSSESSREAQCSPAEGEEPEDEDKDLTDDPTKSGKIMNLRKNIKDVLDPTQLDASTLAAQREESERLARVQEQQRQQREQLRQLAMDKHTKAEEKVLQLLTGHREPVPEEKETKKEIVTIEDSSSDDDCIVVSDDEDEPEDDEDPHNSGLHTNDSYNVPDEKGRVLVNFGHATDEPDVFLAPQIAKIIKPHQIGGIRFLFDNIIESVSRYEQSTGYGCILAHSMGLGKTIQVVSFSDIFLRHTSSRTILIIMPINTLQNWLNEFNMWVPETSDDPEVRTRNFKVFLLNDNHRTLSARAGVVLEWAKSGGVLMIGYEMYRLLSMKKMARSRKKKADLSVEETAEEQKSMFDAIHEALVKPGPDLVICDEGHRIKNSHASISVALKQIKSRRRVVLTGYPLQNNLLEYWCMVDFVRPNYLGTKTEFSNMFERPIQNGQCVDSTPKDIQLMRFRAHVLHSLLVGFVQRRSHFVLQQSLPAKQEYVVLVRMTDFQRQLYETFMNEVVRKQSFPNPLKAFSVCCKIWNHPDVLFNFLRKRELDLDLELDEETTSSVASKKSRSKKAAPKTPEKPPEKVPDAKPAPPPAPETPQYSSSSSNSSFSSFQSASNGSSSYQDPYYYGGGSQNASYRPGYQGQQQHYGQYQQDYYQQQQYGHGHGNYYGSQYGGYYGSQYGSSQSQNYYQGYGNPPGNYEYPYPYQYPQDASAAPPSDTKKEEKAPEPAPVPKTVESEFENKLADEIKEEVESKEEKADGKGKDDSIPYEWASELMKGYVPDLLENSPKMEIFLVLLEESVRSGDRVLLFSQSLLTLNVIEKFLQKKRIPGSNACWAKNTSYFRLDGSTVAQERERLINSFNANKGVFLFLVSTRAGSLGINLVGANRVIVFDASWNPCHDTQAVCRVYRYGQQKPCFVYRIVMDACLEKKIYDRQISKQGMSDRVVDECNPDAHLSMKEVTSFCFDDDEVTEVQDFSEFKDDFASDTAMQKLLLTHSKHLTKKPFQHESLLVDNKEKKLSASEKRMAKRGYEMEKMQASKPAYSYTTMGTTYRAYRTPDGSLVHKAVNQGRSVSQPVSQDSSAARGQRPTTWIPAEVWQQQGMSAQEMTLPSDVVIPTSSADKENIILKAGQRVMVLKSHKGIYMQLESGKIIAIRTAVKPDGTKKGPSEQPGTSSESSNSSISKTETVKSDTDDDDIIMTSITYPDPPQSSSNQPGSGPNPRLAQSSATLAATAGPYMNGRKPPMTETGRRRGRPPTYNGYHPSYIPPGVVPQPLQPYSHASAKNFASSTYDKPTVKESYIPPSQTHSPLKTPQFAASEGPNASEPMLQPAGSHFNPYQPPYGSTRPFEQQPPVPPPPYPQNQPPAQTNGGQQSIHQWQ